MPAVRRFSRVAPWCVALSMFNSAPLWAGAYEDIIVAANQSNTEVVVGLLNRGMDVNTADATGTTLLMIAARTGNELLLDFLLKNKSNILKKNKYGDSAIAIAAIGGRLDMVRKLADHGAEIDGSGSWSPLQYAAFGGRAEIIAYLVERGADVNRKAPNGQTALMLAVKQGHLAAIRGLLENRARVDLIDPDGNTALGLAIATGNTQAADILKQAEAKK